MKFMILTSYGEDVLIRRDQVALFKSARYGGTEIVLLNGYRVFVTEEPHLVRQAMGGDNGH